MWPLDFVQQGPRWDIGKLPGFPRVRAARWRNCSLPAASESATAARRREDSPTPLGGGCKEEGPAHSSRPEGQTLKSALFDFLASGDAFVQDLLLPGFFAYIRGQEAVKELDHLNVGDYN